MMKTHLEIGWSHLVLEEDAKRLHRCLRSFLYPLSLAYGVGVKMRNTLYEKKVLQTQKCPLPVVSIGNIVVGGTGKTPLTAMLAQSLSTFCRVAILSRGYRSKAENAKEPLVLSRGNGPLHGAELAGDEPILLARAVPKAIVIVGKNRSLAAKKAIEEGAQVILLDDGMQHRKLYRDIEVVLIDGKNPFGKGYFLPRGFLRDDPKRLDKADCIIVNGESTVALKNSVKVALKPVEVIDMQGNTVPTIAGKSVALFCAIASPLRFHETVKEMGAHIVLTKDLPDHEKFSSDELIAFTKEAKQKGATLVLCTEKDYVKLTDEKMPLLPIGYVKCAIAIQEGQATWDALVDRIKQLVTR